MGRVDIRVSNLIRRGVAGGTLRSIYVELSKQSGLDGDKNVVQGR